MQLRQLPGTNSCIHTIPGTPPGYHCAWPDLWTYSCAFTLTFTSSKFNLMTVLFLQTDFAYYYLLLLYMLKPGATEQQFLRTKNCREFQKLFVNFFWENIILVVSKVAMGNTHFFTWAINAHTRGGGIGRLNNKWCLILEYGISQWASPYNND